MSGEVERVVFDCVVYAQAIINPDGPAGACLEFAREGVLSLCISDYLLREIRELPGKLAPRLNITPQKVQEFIEDLVSFSRWIADVPHLYTLERDPDDSHYINLALASDAKLISSRDRDLLDLMDLSFPTARDFQTRFPTLRILRPEELLHYVRSARA
jgi:putative PIN family toxin of toxin-antitoxin system